MCKRGGRRFHSVPLPILSHSSFPFLSPFLSFLKPFTFPSPFLTFFISFFCPFPLPIPSPFHDPFMTFFPIPSLLFFSLPFPLYLFFPFLFPFLLLFSVFFLLYTPVEQNPEKTSRKSSLLQIFHRVGEIQTKPYTYLRQFFKQNLNHAPSEKNEILKHPLIL